MGEGVGIFYQQRFANEKIMQPDTTIEIDVGCCSNGSSMLHPTERPPTSFAPRLAASMMPGPPPVITVNPSRAIAAPIFRASS